ncbi:TYRO protein tyrosine kinase-binding protein [Tachysurus fulvidraco]|uniref:TYRO protein tyrosine kinase-binding protein n=1 Tax=Tachysurus fulvidraco TaxID=1234273 RepID=UPI000F4D9B69|nr:TYRO protein tyrosine kinase-binding protein [Tachysurus fulvidraco]XP_027005107.1 TYRO protein tyrosine kinase-binding protein [Tachysurus fulvidraco]
MGWILHFMALLSGLIGYAAATQDCGTCYQLNMEIVTGIIACDIILTVLIIISVYCFASWEKKKNSLHTRKKSIETEKGKFRQSSSRPKEVEITESPYQELYGVQSDIYSDLHQYRK